MDITAICIVGIVIWGTYRLFELFARKKERIAIIEKMEKLNSLEIKNSLDLPSFSNSSKFSSLRIALLLIGLGLGCFLGFFLETQLGSLSYQTKGILYFSVIAIFGGLGLLISYFIESRKK